LTAASFYRKAALRITHVLAFLAMLGGKAGEAEGYFGA
jgi:hypothetical protein